MVEDSKAKPIGVITQSDIVRLFDESSDLTQAVEQAMTFPVITFSEHMSLPDALLMSRTHKINAWL